MKNTVEKESTTIHEVNQFYAYGVVSRNSKKKKRKKNQFKKAQPGLNFKICKSFKPLFSLASNTHFKM